jgi:hypothetical protein
MTRTEERLQDALHASAGRVREEYLRPLPAPGSGARAQTRPGWRGWLAPAAAAAGVVLVIGLAVALTGGTSTLTGGTSAATGGTWRSASGAAAGGGVTTGFPKYFVQFTGTVSPGATMQVRSASTGAVVASAPFPKAPRGWSLQQNTVAAAPDGRTFYVDYDAVHPLKSSLVEQVWIYRLNVPGSGSATTLTRVTGGEFPGVAALGTGGSMAVSPDGTELALTADTTEQLDNTTPGWADKIVVINLRTGARSIWQGGLYRSGKTFTIPDISWTADGQSIVFLGLWCNFPPATNLCSGAQSGTNGYRDTQVRSLPVATGGGTLDRSALLLTQSARYPVIAAAIAGPVSAELSVVVLSGTPGSFGSWSKVAVDRVAAVSGSLLGVDYLAAAHGGEGQPSRVGISADPSGRYILLSYSGQGGLYTGWLWQGKLHFLPVRQPYLGWSISAW